MMATTKRTYHTIHSVKASSIPGDSLRRATRQIVCSDGVVLPAGTLFHAIAGGYDNTVNKTYGDISVLLRE